MGAAKQALRLSDEQFNTVYSQPVIRKLSPKTNTLAIRVLPCTVGCGYQNGAVEFAC